MRLVALIVRRELGHYFSSFVIPVVMILFLMSAGTMFFMKIFEVGESLSLRRFFSDAPFLLSFFCPAVTMGLFSEERKRGSLEVLMSLGIGELGLVMSKFISGMMILLMALLCTLSYAVSLSFLGDLDWGPVFGGYLGLLLLGGCYMSIGLMVSLFSRDSIVAVLVAFFLCFGLYYLDQFASVSGGMMGVLFKFLSANSHFQQISRGVIDLRDVVYYLSIQVFCLSVCYHGLRRLRY